MGAVPSSSGAGSAPPQPFARASGAGAAALTRLPGIQAELSRHASVLWLRTRLMFDARQWAERSAGALVAAFDQAGRAVEALSWGTAKAAIRAIKWRRVALAASAPFVLPGEFRGALVRILAYLGAIGGLSLIAAELFKQPDVTAMVAPPPKPAWLEVDKPWPAFRLDASGFSDEDTHYAIRRHLEGGGRKDTLSFGDLGKTQRYMSFEIYRAGREIDAFGPAAEEARDLAAEHGRVTGLRSSIPIGSKFGQFRTFEFAIGPFNSYNCIGFVRAMDKPRVQIAGLSCNMKLLIDRSAISCALDRLSLVSAGSDPDIARVFAKAELNRSFCGMRDHLLYATPKRPGDVTSSVVEKPRLRGRFAR